MIVVGDAVHVSDARECSGGRARAVGPSVRAAPSTAGAHPTRIASLRPPRRGAVTGRGAVRRPAPPARPQPDECDGRGGSHPRPLAHGHESYSGTTHPASDKPATANGTRRDHGHRQRHQPDCHRRGRELRLLGGPGRVHQERSKMTPTHHFTAALPEHGRVAFVADRGPLLPSLYERAPFHGGVTPGAVEAMTPAPPAATQSVCRDSSQASCFTLE